MTNAIVAKNNASSNVRDCSGSLTSLGHNLIGFTVGCGFIPGPGDWIGTVDVPLDPKIGPSCRTTAGLPLLTLFLKAVWQLIAEMTKPVLTPTSEAFPDPKAWHVT